MRIQVDLSSSSLNQAAEELRSYAKTLDGKAQALCESLAADAATDAQANCPTSRVSVGYRAKASGATVYATGEVVSPADNSYSVPLSQLVEFGTGIGAGAGYAAEHGFERDVNGHGGEGWLYYKDGSFYRTTGQRAHKFMGNAAERARADLISKAKGVFES